MTYEIADLLINLNNLRTGCSEAASYAKSPDHHDLGAAAMWERAADEIARSIRQIEFAKASHDKVPSTDGLQARLP